MKRYFLALLVLALVTAVGVPLVPAAPGARRAQTFVYVHDGGGSILGFAWAKDGTIEVLRRDYDRILVYGRREVFDPIDAYGIPEDVAEKMRFVGYIPRLGRFDPEPLRKRFAPRTGRWVLVALGGGGDGDVLLKKFLEGYRSAGARPPFEVVAVTGPLSLIPGSSKPHLASGIRCMSSPLLLTSSVLPLPSEPIE